MHPRLQEVIAEVRSNNPSVIKDAVVKVGLVLEADTQRKWDEKTIAFYPHSGLYEQVYSPEDIDALISRVETLLADPVHVSERLGLIWALSKANRVEAFGLLLRLLRSPLRDTYITGGAILPIIRDFLFLAPETAMRSGHLHELRELVGSLTFQHDAAEIVREISSLIQPLIENG